MKEAKTKDVEKFLRSKGWEIARQRGIHDVWKGPGERQTLAIPRHVKCSPGIIRQIAKIIPDIPQSWR